MSTINGPYVNGYNPMQYNMGNSSAYQNTNMVGGMCSGIFMMMEAMPASQNMYGQGMNMSGTGGFPGAICGALFMMTAMPISSPTNYGLMSAAGNQAPMQYTPSAGQYYPAQYYPTQYYQPQSTYPTANQYPMQYQYPAMACQNQPCMFAMFFILPGQNYPYELPPTPQAGYSSTAPTVQPAISIPAATDIVTSSTSGQIDDTTKSKLTNAADLIEDPKKNERLENAAKLVTEKTEAEKKAEEAQLKKEEAEKRLKAAEEKIANTQPDETIVVKTTDPVRTVSVKSEEKDFYSKVEVGKDAEKSSHPETFKVKQEVGEGGIAVTEAGENVKANVFQSGKDNSILKAVTGNEHDRVTQLATGTNGATMIAETHDGGDSVKQWGSQGPDVQKFIGGSGVDHIQADSGDENDVVEVDSKDGSDDVKVDMGKGDDVGTIKTGSGWDTVNVYDDTGNDDYTIETGGKSDTINIRLENSASSQDTYHIDGGTNTEPEKVGRDTVEEHDTLHINPLMKNYDFTIKDANTGEEIYTPTDSTTGKPYPGSTVIDVENIERIEIQRPGDDTVLRHNNDGTWDEYDHKTKTWKDA
jgi:hypothetical protein